MPIHTPGFPPGTLADDGLPIWIHEVAATEQHHALHVVRGIGPQETLEALGIDPRNIRTCILPAAGADRYTSLPAAFLEAEHGHTDTLLAGANGPWTFVYDDSAAVDEEQLTELSSGSRAAASTSVSINADVSLSYAVDGAMIHHVDLDDLVLERDLPHMPDELRTAFRAAGTVKHDYLSAGKADHAICMRAVCALAGLIWTVQDLRSTPLWAAACE
ncbi:hypothetical protein GCM10010277_73640 [Streptomyces longisporoflavus]|uniref:DUF6461 domain-containing protein n=1 Tax=Streptomyces longisporoflavus TaxID=28044 RepID=UPI0019C18DD4|nr:DUF6461 domain-containing protein [Streptomyces longisporoflavus]GGV66067.1 hypothetical protein GCM10010277_73640 [Streptomyces longisporoflavus]